MPPAKHNDAAKTKMKSTVSSFFISTSYFENFHRCYVTPIYKKNKPVFRLCQEKISVYKIKGFLYFFLIYTCKNHRYCTDSPGVAARTGNEHRRKHFYGQRKVQSIRISGKRTAYIVSPSFVICNYKSSFVLILSTPQIYANMFCI